MRNKTTITPDSIPPFVLTGYAEYIVDLKSSDPQKENFLITNQDFSHDNNGVKTMLYLAMDYVKQALDKMGIEDQTVLENMKQASLFLVDIDFTRSDLLRHIQKMLDYRLHPAFLNMFIGRYPALKHVCPVSITE